MCKFKFKARTLLLSAGLLALVCTFTLGAGFLPDQGMRAHNTTPVAWYSNTNNTAHVINAKNFGQQKTLASDYAKSLSRAFHDAASKALPSVVMITNTPAAIEHTNNQGQSNDDNFQDYPFGFRGAPFDELFNNPNFRQFFRHMPMPEMPRHGVVGAGSGVIVDPSGVVLTNYHVVAGKGKIVVRLQDGREFKAFGIKTDPKTDLAILRIKGAGKLKAARLGNSDSVEVGDWVLALGQPFGLEGTVTAGIVSAMQRGLGIAAREDFIQTDAAINPGNSGGPLVNLEGEVVGINTAISTSNGGYQGVGFAIPINLAKWVGGDLERYNTVRRAYLGVGIQPVTQS
ncbi:MAG: trypsin-like peptidase domain-containing protein, partial [Thermoguttaceae bacterium]